MYDFIVEGQTKSCSTVCSQQRERLAEMRIANSRLVPAASKLNNDASVGEREKIVRKDRKWAWGLGSSEQTIAQYCNEGRRTRSQGYPVPSEAPPDQGEEEES